MSTLDEDPGADDRRYRDLIGRIRAIVDILLPEGARVLVVSHGDEALLRLGARQAEHFPQSKTGLYAGHHPADGAEAASHLSALRRSGFDYLVLPATTLWWLEYYPELAAALENEELVCDEPQTCLVYTLGSRGRDAEALEPAALAAVRSASQVSALIDALVPAGDGVVLVGPGGGAVELGERPLWRIEDTRARRWSRVDAEREVEAAREEGARYLVVLKPADPRDWPDERLTAPLTASARPVFEQRLAAGFELAKAERPEAVS
jgi:hypothetical protein